MVMKHVEDVTSTSSNYVHYKIFIDLKKTVTEEKKQENEFMSGL